MSDILARLARQGFVPFLQLFRPEEGRMGVTVTFVAILELMREGLIDIVQTEAYAPLHVRAGNPHPQLRVVGSETETPEAGGASAPLAQPSDASDEDPA
jgi:segregation and condensation protein A